MWEGVDRGDGKGMGGSGKKGRIGKGRGERKGKIMIEANRKWILLFRP